MSTKLKVEDIANANWSFHQNADGTMSYEAFGAAAMNVAARRLSIVAGKLDSIISRLDALGRDGLHDVIRDMARQVRKKNRRLARLRKARAARRALKAVA